MDNGSFINYGLVRSSHKAVPGGKQVQQGAGSPCLWYRERWQDYPSRHTLKVSCEVTDFLQEVFTVSSSCAWVNHCLVSRRVILNGETRDSIRLGDAAQRARPNLSIGTSLAAVTEGVSSEQLERLRLMVTTKPRWTFTTADTSKCLSEVLGSGLVNI